MVLEILSKSLYRCEEAVHRCGNDWSLGNSGAHEWLNIRTMGFLTLLKLVRRAGRWRSGRSSLTPESILLTLHCLQIQKKTKKVMLVVEKETQGMWWVSRGRGTWELPRHLVWEHAGQASILGSRLGVGGIWENEQSPEYGLWDALYYVLKPPYSWAVEGRVQFPSGRPFTGDWHWTC